VLFEGEKEHHFVETVFWKGDLPSAAAPASSDGKQNAVSEVVPADSAKEPLAAPLMDAILALLFKQEFTCAGASDTAVWEGGMGGGAGGGKGSAYDAARAEMLKLLLVTCSETLYVTPDEYKAAENRWLTHYTSRSPELSTRVLVSLCNSIFSYDPVGYGIPYSSSLLSDPREGVVDAALQTLIVVLDYSPGSPAAASDAAGAGKSGPAGIVTERVLDSTPAAQHAASGNSFRGALRGLSGDRDFDVLFDGFCRLLNNPHQANNTLLPSSMKQISCFQELLILFWKLIDENKDFLGYILRVGDINEVVVPMLYFMYEGRKDPSKIGLIHICTFILLLLSGERNFCVNLNAAFAKRLPVDLPPFTGNHADLLYIVIHKLMTDGPNKLDTLYDCFLTTMSNVSPYIKTFCMPAAMRATNLFEMFATKKRLLASEHYPRYLVFTLEVFNNVIQYQYEGNPHFIYQILRRKKVFAELSALAEGKAPPATPETPTAASEGGEGKGKVTEEWLKTWAESLPLQPCLRIMQHLLPQLEQFCISSTVNDEAIVVDFLRTTTMVGLLPVPHPILIRKYQQNEYTSLWFTTYIWGVVYLRNQTPAYFDAPSIKLFTISYVDA